METDPKQIEKYKEYLHKFEKQVSRETALGSLMRNGFQLADAMASLEREDEEDDNAELEKIVKGTAGIELSDGKKQKGSVSSSADSSTKQKAPVQSDKPKEVKTEPMDSVSSSTESAKPKQSDTSKEGSSAGDSSKQAAKSSSKKKGGKKR